MSVKYFWRHYQTLIIGGLFFIVVTASLTFIGESLSRYKYLSQFTHELTVSKTSLTADYATTSAQLASVSATLAGLMAEDQRLRNNALETELTEIRKTYNQAAVVYEDLVDLRAKTSKTTKYDDQFALILKTLAQRNYATSSSLLTKLKSDIAAEETKIATEFKIPENVPVNNAPPGSGYSRQQVVTDIGTYMVSIVAADLNSTRVIADTASDNTCTNDCPVLALGDYVARSGAFAGINGPYFCPASYPACAGKTNSFDTLLMNKNKVYFNSENNVYSSVPAVIFQGNSARFVGRSSEWGRDTSPDSVIAAQPFLVSNGNVVFGGDGDPKKGSKGARGFIGVSGSTVYIGFVHNATVAESARVLAKMGVQNALNLDSGGSSALWSGGYKIGPGRALPIGILLVRK